MLPRPRSRLAVAVLSSLAVCAPVAIAAAHPASTAQASPVFGVNMSLFDTADQVMNDAATQRLFSGWGVPMVRVPMRQNLHDDTLTKALSAVKAIGAAPVVILNGPGEVTGGDSAVLARDLHLLDLVEGVFPDGPVYLEYGNEDDLTHGISASAYTTSWNTVVGRLKEHVPAGYKFVGPVNFQSNPAYVGTFVAGANPRPDFVSWHEYVCQAADTSKCTANIAHWTTHAQNTDAAMQAAIHTTVPFLITEWNVDPANTPADLALYRDPAFIQPWTEAALDELGSLTALGLRGAMLYTASNHDAFGLVTAGPALTPQGQVFAKRISHPAPPTTPTSTPPAGTTTVGFEDGTDGWSPRWGHVAADVTTDHAYEGSHALNLTVDGSTYSAVGTSTGVGHLRPGDEITFHIRSGGHAAGVRPFVQDEQYRTHFAQDADIAIPAGADWTTVTWRVPDTGSVRTVGLQVTDSDGAALTLALDGLTWPNA